MREREIRTERGGFPNQESEIYGAETETDRWFRAQ